jgi:hypothetical protein
MNRYDNDKLYADYVYEDETSQFDPKGRWMGGSEYYARTYHARVPRKMLERCTISGDHTELTYWLEKHGHKLGVYR